MIYFTSDLHLGHNAVINMQNRPFADADEMDQRITILWSANEDFVWYYAKNADNTSRKGELEWEKES